MSLRRTLLGLHRQTRNLSLSPSAHAAVVRRDISSIPFALAQKLKPESTNLVTDRSISSIRQSDLDKAKKFSPSRGYSNVSFLPKLHVLYHINEGMEEILADYVHQEMTRNLMVISLGLFQFIVIKDIFLFLF